MEHTYISSRQNPTLLRFESLSGKKGRDKEGLFLAEGRKLCREAVGRCDVRYALLCESRAGDSELAGLAHKSGGEIIVLSDGAFAKVSSDKSPDGIIFVCAIPDMGGEVLRGERVFILEAVRDPGNVGTVIRSAAAFGCDRLVLAGCADIYNPKTVRAAMGALFKMKFTVCGGLDSVIPDLKKQGRRVIASALKNGAGRLGEYELRHSDCIIVGNEGHGVSDSVCRAADGVIYIPMTDKTESLNAAAAAAVLLWEQSNGKD